MDKYWRKTCVFRLTGCVTLPLPLSILETSLRDHVTNICIQTDACLRDPLCNKSKDPCIMRGTLWNLFCYKWHLSDHQVLRNAFSIYMGQCQFVPYRCVPERKFSDVPSLRRCAHWMMRPLEMRPRKIYTLMGSLTLWWHRLAGRTLEAVAGHFWSGLFGRCKGNQSLCE